MIHRFFLWLADLIDPGEWTATVAKLRLQDVISDDRAAVPCGRWVLVQPILYIEQLRYWGIRHQNKKSSMPLPPKPDAGRCRYRYEVRR